MMQIIDEIIYQNIYTKRTLFFQFYRDLFIFVKKNYQWRKIIFREVPLIKMVSIRSVEFIREM